MEKPTYMSRDAETTTGPLVSVLVPTFNRRRYLREALASLLGQTYGRFEAIVVNDGGEPVDDVVRGFADPRLALIERRENRAKAASLNEALRHASGAYVAYLDDDDLYYPHHLARLVEALEADTDCGAAYTDRYTVYCRILPGGERQVRGKVVNVSRDFDRFVLSCVNHVPHVSLMHRRDLLEQTGPYNEQLSILIDWDIVRRLAFFTDFVRVGDVTGESYTPVGASDRIWHGGRLDRQTFLANTLRIRTTRPPKPWPRMPDLSIVALPDRIDEAAADMIRQIYAMTFMPFEVYLPAAPPEVARLRIDMPNLVTVPATGGSIEARLDAALDRLGGDYVAVVPHGVPMPTLWVEDALHAAVHDSIGRTAFTLTGHSAARPAFVLGAAALRRAREGRGERSLLESIHAAGLQVRPPQPRERALGFDRVLQAAESLEEDGNWVQAAALYKRIPPRFGNERSMRERAAAALYRAGKRDAEALRIVRDLNGKRATVSTLLLEARLHRRSDRLREAVGLLERARLILNGKGLPCN